MPARIRHAAPGRRELNQCEPHIGRVEHQELDQRVETGLGECSGTMRTASRDALHTLRAGLDFDLAMIALHVDRQCYRYRRR